VLTAGTCTLEAFAGGAAGGVHGTTGSFGTGQGGSFQVELTLAPQPVPALPHLGSLVLGVLLASSSRAAACKCRRL
jgi:hypothetical protein